MKPLIVLLAVFIISLFTIKIISHEYDIALAAQIAMSAMLLFTAIAHFAFTKGMAMMIPDIIPFKTAIVYLSGVAEIICAIGLLIPSYRVITAWVLIVLFVLLIPANINAALKRINYQKGTYDGDGPCYLWFRIPLQLFFIGWIIFCAL
jgi:uncharacterized membrane protein